MFLYFPARYFSKLASHFSNIRVGYILSAFSLSIPVPNFMMRLNYSLPIVVLFFQSLNMTYELVPFFAIFLEWESSARTGCVFDPFHLVFHFFFARFWQFIRRRPLSQKGLIIKTFAKCHKGHKGTQRLKPKTSASVMICFVQEYENV